MNKSGKLKYIMMLCMLFISLVMLCSCGSKSRDSKNVNDKEMTVKSLAYDIDHKENLVYVSEGGTYIPFIVMAKNYGGNVLLLRKEVLPKVMRYNDYSSYYEDSEIDIYLNNNYYSELTYIQPIIAESDIIITDKDSLGIAGQGTTSITRRIFLLSCEELNIKLELCGKEGKALEYFKKLEHRIVCDSAGPINYWTRTACTWNFSCPYVIGYDGSIAEGNAFNINGIRPALCVKPDAKVELKEGIVEGEKVYVFTDTE